MWAKEETRQLGIVLHEALLGLADAHVAVRAEALEALLREAGGRQSVNQVLPRRSSSSRRQETL